MSLWNSTRPALLSRRMAMRGGVALSLAGLTLAGCAPGADLPMLPNYEAQAYRLGGGDQLRIIVYGEDQLTGEYSVDDQGKIAVPLLGSVQATGLTTSGLESEIARQLSSRNLMHDPSVAVEILAYRPIFVLGEVSKPGQYPFQPGMTMLTAVAVAGGFTYRGVKAYAGVVRTVNGHAAEQGKIVPDSFIAPGDVVTIFERRF